MTTFGERLRHLLDTAGITQNDLATMVDYSPASVTKWIKNRGEPNFKVVRQICEEFDCSADWLLGLSQHSPARTYEHAGIRWVEDIPDWINDSQRKEFEQALKIFRQFVIDGMQRSDLHSLPSIPIRDSSATFYAALRIGALRITNVPRNDKLEADIKSRFNIKQAIVADIPEYIDGTPPRVEFVTFLAATEAMKMLRNPIAVGLGSGFTMLRFAEQSLPQVAELRGTKWIPLMAFPDNNLGPLTANAIALQMSQRHSGSQALQMPYLREQDKNSTDHIEQELKNATAVFFSVNGIGRAQNWKGEPLDFVQEFRSANYETALNPLSDMYGYLEKTGKHDKFGGELLGCLLDRDGMPFPELADMQKDNYCSIELQQIRDLASYGALVWLIAARRYKADAVLTAIKSGLANALVIDREIALYLLEQS